MQYDAINVLTTPK